MATAYMERRRRDPGGEGLHLAQRGDGARGCADALRRLWRSAAAAAVAGGLGPNGS
jgi:hypothetical protein